MEDIYVQPRHNGSILQQLQGLHDLNAMNQTPGKASCTPLCQPAFPPGILGLHYQFLFLLFETGNLRLRGKLLVEVGLGPDLGDQLLINGQ